MLIGVDTDTRRHPRTALPWRLYHEKLLDTSVLGPDMDLSTDIPAIESRFGPMELSEDLSPEITNAILEGIQTVGGLRQICEIYTQLIRQLPQVKQVLLWREGGLPRITTLLDTAPFDRSQRNDVYAAQLAALQRATVEIEFRVITLSEVDGEVSTVIPSDAEVLYQKS